MNSLKVSEGCFNLVGWWPVEGSAALAPHEWIQ